LPNLEKYNSFIAISGYLLHIMDQKRKNKVISNM